LDKHNQQHNQQHTIRNSNSNIHKQQLQNIIKN
jgi:hypothetical protein